MFRRYEERCYIKIQVARGKNASHALEHCKKLAGEKSYLIKLLQHGWKPSIKEESHHRAPSEIRCCNRLSPCSGCKGFIVRGQMLDMCGDFQELGIAASTVHTILIKKLNMRKICAHWVPHTLTEIGKWQRMDTARIHLEQYEHEGKAFLHHVITAGFL